MSTPTDSIGVAVIGLGTVGLRYVEQFQIHDGFHLVGGFDVSETAAAAAAEQFAIPIAESAQALISDDGVGLVYVAVPPLHHEVFVDACIDAGKALLCEKPLGVDDAQSAAMVKRVDASGIAAAVNFVFGAAPPARALAAAVASHDEPIHHAALRVHFETWPRAWQANAGWLRDRDQGGWTREVVSHYLFLLLRLFGDAAVETVHVEWPADGTSEQGLQATLRYGPVPAFVAGTSDSAGVDEVEFTVRSASTAWRLTNWYQFSHSIDGGEWKPAIDTELAGGPRAYAAQLDQMAKLARGEAHTLATFAEALKVQELAEALLAHP